jgi:radical S-adenosyl methionine domain-containing protein 2
MIKNNNQDLTVNWHFFNGCNMSCRYCFVSKLSDSLNFSEQLIILGKLSLYFSRINFVGGEPTLSKNLIPLIDKANALNMKTSIITNGYRMVNSEAYANDVISRVDSIGLSVDSLKPIVKRLYLPPNVLNLQIKLQMLINF